MASTFHYVDAFRRHSRHRVSYLDIGTRVEQPVDLSRFDAVWVNFCVRLQDRGYFPEALAASLAAYRGLKLAAAQDEYDNTDHLRRALREIGADVVLTCVPQGSIQCVYPRDMFPHTRFETVLTGYVSDELCCGRATLPLSERPIVVGYRARDVGFRYGDLGWQKVEIGRRVRQACLDRGIVCDIAMDEAARLYGSHWFDFIGSCRVMLGSESGSNIFDFDGSVSRHCEGMRAANPKLAYEQYRPLPAKRESAIDMGQVSPRIFEAAAMRTALVLIRARYSGVLEPDIHYIPLSPDYSNLDEVLRRIEDIPALERMAERTYRDLIASGAYSYAAFVDRIDALIDQGCHDCVTRGAIPNLPPLDANLLSPRPTGNEAHVVELTTALIQARADIDRLLGEIEQLRGERNELLVATFAGRFSFLVKKMAARLHARKRAE